MKIFIYTIVAVLMFSSCSVNRDYLSRADEDKTMYDVVKRLNKKSDDPDATAAIAQVYSQVVARHSKRIATYKNYPDISKWDKLLSEYSALQEIFHAIDNSAAASRLVTPVSYQNDIINVKQAAAEDYYSLGNSYLAGSSRENGRKAYYAFNKANSWVAGYKDTREKMDEAFNSSVINVLINPIQDNSFFSNTGWGNMGYNYSNEFFQQNLVRDLGGKYSTRYPARFYTDWEARRADVQPDWVVDLTLRNMDIPRPAINNYRRNVSKDVKISTDTSGKPVYKTVYATLNIQRQAFIARAQMDVNIVDIASRRNIAYNTYSDTYTWQDERATYTGDQRALSQNDIALLNNSNFNMPRREDILRELYRNIYPQVKNRISNAADW